MPYGMVLLLRRNSIRQPSMGDFMNRLLATTAIALMAAGPAMAQTAVGVGVSSSTAKSASQSTALAIGGGNAGAKAVSTGSNAIVTSNIPANQSITNVPTVFAPGLAAAGIETCLGSVSGGGSWLGTGISFGGTVPDPNCTTRLDARTLWSMGLKRAAVARLCVSPDIYRSMPEVCGAYLPVAVAPIAPIAPVAYAGGDIWLVDGKSRKDRLCKDYDAPAQRCRHWDGIIVHHAATKKGLVHGGKTVVASKEDLTK